MVAVAAIFCASLMLYPLLGVAFFPRTDAGQFVVNLKSPSGTRIEVSAQDVAKVETLIRSIVDPHDLDLIVSNIGVIPGFSSIYTSNAGPHTATIQVALKEDHRIGSYEYMARVRTAIQRELPYLSAFFQSGGMVDAVLNQGLPAPIDVQLSGSNVEAGVPQRRARSPPTSASCPASATSTFRRTSTIRRCASTSIASAPASSASISAKSSTTSSPR